MPDVHTILLTIVVVDALLVMAFGVVTAGFVLLDVKREGLVSRIPLATFVLVLSSLGCGVLLWGGNALFGG